ncbi:hypothetical protein [Myroides injenensis]|uniref:hypothetical protein n=1 Tax=Myroides injenensis TaxID=1183151 RepID=UPI0002887470|nr:hypothetical protein [Myroides injenensis]
MNFIKYVFSLCSLLLVIGCGQGISNDDLVNLNGYWEIEKVKLPDGKEKDYTINGTIDFFELKDNNHGLRQKVMPQFNGEYLTNEVPESFVIEQVEGKSWLNYKTEYSEWKEQLVKLNKEHLVVKNEQDILYYYKRPVAFSLK